MTTCHRFQVSLTEYLYDSISAFEKSELHEHLKHCPSCRELHTEFQKTLHIIESFPEPVPATPDIWQSLEDHLKPIKNRDKIKAILPEKRLYFRLGLGFSGLAATLLLIWILMPSTLPPDKHANEGQVVEVFLNEAKPLLLSLSNRKVTDTLTLNLEKRRTKKLLTELEQINEILERTKIPKEQRRLVADIETLLLQLNNLSPMAQADGLNIIQNQLTEQDILFRINLLNYKKHQLVTN